jgi:hypothetical protein
LLKEPGLAAFPSRPRLSELQRASAAWLNNLSPIGTLLLNVIYALRLQCAHSNASTGVYAWARTPAAAQGTQQEVPCLRELGARPQVT